MSTSNLQQKLVQFRKRALIKKQTSFLLNEHPGVGSFYERTFEACRT